MHRTEAINTSCGKTEMHRKVEKEQFILQDLDVCE